MKYEKKLAELQKNLEQVVSEAKKRKLERFSLFHHDNNVNDISVIDNKLIYEEVTDEQIENLEIIEKKILNTKSDSSREGLINFAEMTSNIIILIGIIIGISSLFVAAPFFQLDITNAILIIIIGFFSGTLIFSIAAIIKLLILLNQRKI